MIVEPRADDNSCPWSEPGVYSVAPGVYRIPLPLPDNTLCAVNVYAITDGTELVLIDSGWVLDGVREHLTRCLKAIGATLGDVSRFLVTHAHRDHYTQAVALRRDFGSRIALGEHEATAIRLSRDADVQPMTAQFRLLRRAGAGALATELAKPSRRDDIDLWEDPDEWLTPGRRTILPGRQLDIVHTPGHTPGHVVFDDHAAGLLFAGDHVLPHITPSLDFQPAPAELPLRDYLGSLRVVRAMPDRRLLPAHGPIGPSVHARVDELLEHHGQRLDAMAEQVLAGASTAYATAVRLRWTRHQRMFADLDPFHRMLAVLETAAHLDFLATRGVLVYSEVDGVRYYQAP